MQQLMLTSVTIETIQQYKIPIKHKLLLVKHVISQY